MRRPPTMGEITRAEKNGIAIGTLRARIRRGWDRERAITESTSKDREKWLKVAKKNNIGQVAFDNRIYGMGWSFERAATDPIRKCHRRKVYVD